MFWKRSAILIAAATLALGTLAGCHKSSSGSSSGADLPAAADLLTKAQTAMGTVQSVHFTIKVDGTISGLPLQSADGVLTKEGNAKGSAKISELGVTVEADFVVVGQDFYVKALTGGYQKTSLAQASSIYDPSAILDPNRGIAHVLATAQNPKTVGTETINGNPTYKVTLTADGASIDSLIPGASGNISGTVWIDQKTDRVDQATFGVPSSGSTANVTVTFDQYDQPVTITPPAQ